MSFSVDTASAGVSYCVLMTTSSAVLLSWVAKKNDPFEEPSAVQKGGPSEPVPGPTLTLLFDEASPYRGKVGDVVLLYRIPPSPQAATTDRQVVQDTEREIEKRNPKIRVQSQAWLGEDPTDHQALFAFLRERVPRIREQFKGRELIIHASPGTPAMHTLWVLMAECGFIEPPFKLVKSYRPRERGGSPAVVEFSLGIESFYKVYRSSQPQRRDSVETAVFWDPTRFRSPRLKELFAEARRYARLKVPILLLGERGTGKTTLASWLRSNSPFRREQLDRSWPSVACGQFSGDTIKSELFGHKAGAFTDAKTDKKGLLSVAHGDTLFLDEIGDISRDVQRLLIRALEERSYTPLGGESSDSLKSDFRLIAATNLPLRTLQERLDPDFFDRISPLELRMPALREIREDLPWLWESMYRTALERAGLDQPPPPLPDSEQQRILRALAEHPLPGNLRDLLKLAYRLIARLGDPDSSRNPSECVEHVLAGPFTPSTPSLGSGQLLTLLSAFAHGETLDEVLTPGTRLPLEHIDGELAALKTYVAQEIGRIAALRGVAESTLYTGVSDRAMRNWKRHEPPPSASGSRKKASAST